MYSKISFMTMTINKRFFYDYNTYSLREKIRSTATPFLKEDEIHDLYFKKKYQIIERL